ncbi:MAG: PAS domain S-box protein [Acidobacteriota bacterium]
MAKRWELREGTPREEWESDAAQHLADQFGTRAIVWVDSSNIARWIVPLERQETYTGLNIASDERRRVALEAVLEMREVQLTLAFGRYTGSTGFLVCVPLFVSERFDGFLQSVFRANELFDSLSSEHTSLGYSIVLFDGEKEIINSSEGNTPGNPDWLQETTIEIRNVTWRLQVWPRPELVASMRSSLPEVALATGLLLILLMYITVRLAQTARLRAQEVGETNKEQITERKRSEDRYRLLSRHANDAIIQRDESGHILDANERALDLFGYSREEMLRLRVRDLVAWESETAVTERLSEIGKSGGAMFENMHRRRDGSLFSGEVSARAVKVDGKEIAVAIIRDVTQRNEVERRLEKRSEDLQATNEELRLSESKFSNFLDSAPDAIVGINQEGQIVLVNAQTERLFGYDRAEMLGRPIEILLPEHLREKHVGPHTAYFFLSKARMMGVCLSMGNLYGRRSDGSEFPVDISLSPLEAEDGLLAGSCCPRFGKLLSGVMERRWHGPPTC